MLPITPWEALAAKSKGIKQREGTAFRVPGIDRRIILARNHAVMEDLAVNSLGLTALIHCNPFKALNLSTSLAAKQQVLAQPHEIRQFSRSSGRMRPHGRCIGTRGWQGASCRWLRQLPYIPGLLEGAARGGT